MVTAKQVAKYGTNAQVFEGSALLTRKTILTCSELAKNKKTGKVVDASSLKSLSPDQVEFSKKCYVVVTGKDVAVPPTKAQPAKQTSPKQTSPKKSTQPVKQASPKKSAQPVKETSPKQTSPKQTSPKKSAQTTEKVGTSKKKRENQGTIRLKKSEINKLFSDHDENMLFLTHQKGDKFYYYQGRPFLDIDTFKCHIIDSENQLIDVDTNKSLNLNRPRIKPSSKLYFKRQGKGYVHVAGSQVFEDVYPSDRVKFVVAVFDKMHDLPIVEQSFSKGQSHKEYVATLLSNRKILFRGFCLNYEEYIVLLMKKRITRYDVDENPSLLDKDEILVHPLTSYYAKK